MNKEVEVKKGYIFNQTRSAHQQGKKVIIHKGGTGSGKTYDLVLFLMGVSGTYQNQIITVVSESHPHLQIGAIRILKSVLQQAGAWGMGKWKENPTVWQHPDTNSIIEFFSADRLDKALGARRDWLFGNEINSLKLEVWDELARRSENVIGDFNPTSQFWLEEWLKNYDDTTVVVSNYTHNRFLPETERKRIEKRAERDANFRRIHIDCEYGIYEGLVFDSWQQVDNVPDGKVKYGLDFGYTNDPSCLIKVTETPDAYYLEELIYQTGLLNKDIGDLMAARGVIKNYDEIIADSAEPKSIDELRLMGYNVKSSVKGADSIRSGINKLKEKQLLVKKTSVNLIRELRNYSWVADKEGKPTNKPVDAFNHAIDACRYAISERNEEIFII